MKKKDKVVSREAMIMKEEGPHKLIRKEIRDYLKRAKQEDEEEKKKKDLFDIDKTEWKELE